ncbi:hypothetical protein HHK36_031071 [Tetracentron sinense]|uniref:SCP domain-containing protein n=1 Tax=Tetracentron sinense TaxID=13715 RepID=A0A834YCV1_TETSI|nr:hypothetical protein HHK36_031071 [Tetracentron sinense]
MESSRLILVMVCVFVFLVSICQAQNSPDDFVNAHNNVRSQVGLGLPYMTWNNTVASYARSYAQNRTTDCALKLSDTDYYGENVFVGTISYTGVFAVNAWADEKQYYNYTTNTCAQCKVCGHYTQVVWRASTSLGCARVTCNNGWIFITCNYYPPGNFVGQRPY